MTQPTINDGHSAALRVSSLLETTAMALNGLGAWPADKMLFYVDAIEATLRIAKRELETVIDALETPKTPGGSS